MTVTAAAAAAAAARENLHTAAPRILFHAKLLLEEQQMAPKET